MTQDAEVVEGYTVSEAAKLLNISKNAVRKRVQRGSLSATKVDGEWRIFLQDEASEPNTEDNGVHHDTGQGVSQEVALDLARQQLETFRDAFVMPLVERIGELEHDNGRLEAENEQLAASNGELRRRIEELELVDENGGSKPWWKWW